VLKSIKLEGDSLWITLLLIAALPAVCEELAFRGFILSGFRRFRSKWSAILVSSLFFGATHAIFQQSIVAFLLGSVIGFVAVQTGSLLPGVLFHVIHNSLALLAQRLPTAEEAGWLRLVVHDANEHGQVYQWPVVVASVIASGAILYWFHRLPDAEVASEAPQDAIEHQSPHWLPG
jgi:sodium transport system permease protein